MSKRSKRHRSRNPHWLRTRAKTRKPTTKLTRRPVQTTQFDAFYEIRKYTERAFQCLLDRNSSLIFKLPPNPTILEIGCGNDYLYDHLPESMRREFLKNWIHSDVSDTILAKNRQKHPGKRYKKLDILSPQLEPESIDMVIGLATIDYFKKPSDMQKAIENIHRLLKPGSPFVHFHDLLGVGYFYSALAQGSSFVPAAKIESTVPTVVSFGFYLMEKSDYDKFMATIPLRYRRLIKNLDTSGPAEVNSAEYINIARLVEASGLPHTWMPGYETTQNIIAESVERVFGNVEIVPLEGKILGPARPFQQPNRFYAHEKGVTDMTYVLSPDATVTAAGREIPIGNNVYERIKMPMIRAVK